jgi:ankyrin repeat protein
LFTFIQINGLFHDDVLQGRTPLHVSAWQGHVDMVALLLTIGGADVNATDNENRTALHSASWQGHASIVRLLLEHGARPDHTCNQGATALGEMACYR